MSNGPDDWIYDIIPAKQVAEIEGKAEELHKNMDNGLNIVLGASNDSAIRLCQTYQKGLRGDIESWIHVMGFVAALIETIEQHLDEEGINPYE